MRRVLLLVLLLTACIGCDQGTKALASQTLKGTAPISFLGDTVRLQYALNPGAFLGMGASLPDGLRFSLFTAMNAALILGLLGYLLVRRDMPKGNFFALALIVAGGLGNLIDRVFADGLVVDFMNLGIGRLRTGIFNVADIAIVAGGLLLVYAGRKPKEAAEEQA